MSRHVPILLIILCVGVYPPGRALLHETQAAQSHLDATSRCNVLFIAIDDLRAELGCYGSEHIHSPNIDKLATRATLFERAYCQQAVCNPSRASALTGLRPATLEIWDLPTHFRARFPDIVTLPQHFKNNGYYAQNVGKIFHNWRQDDFKGDPSSWSAPEVLHYNTHGADKPMVEGELPPQLEERPKLDRRDVPDEAYFDGRVADLAVKALTELKKRDEPFFLGVGFWKPHSHFNAPEKYWQLYDREKLPPASNPDPPQDVPEIALHDGREINRSFKNNPDGRPTPAEAAAMRHGYFANISYMDAQLGKVIDAVDRLGLRDNTIIVVWSDHGFHLGENSLWAKTSNFELDAQVPLLIATPNHTPGQRTQALVELLDLYPTLVDLCNLPDPDHKLEGTSLKPLLENPNQSVKDAAFTWHPRPAYPPERSNPDAMGFSMRTNQFRYTEWRDHQTGAILARELYDHQVDPQETKNLAKHPDHSASIKSLQKRLEKTHPPKKS